jgi:AraC-like DNA-binding protein
LTPRTVQRNLESEGTAFKNLVDDARKDYTLAEIEGAEFTVAGIAYRLGYKYLSSFCRAFKCWTGMTPVDYREKYQADDNSKYQHYIVVALYDSFSILKLTSPRFETPVRSR